MDVATELSNKPPSDFEEVKRDRLFELKLTDSTELWLMQWPLNHPPDFDGQEVSLELDNDGHLGSLESSSGKSYDVINLKSQDQKPNFLFSASEAEAVQKTSRHVSFVHYSDPSEFQKHNKISLKEVAQRSSTMTKTGSAFRLSTATKSSKHKHSQSTSVYTASTPSSRYKSSSSKLGEPSKSPKQRNSGEPTKSTNQSLQDSGRANSAVTTSGSAGHSQERKSKKLRKF